MNTAASRGHLIILVLLSSGYPQIEPTYTPCNLQPSKVVFCNIIKSCFVSTQEEKQETQELC